MFCVIPENKKINVDKRYFIMERQVWYFKIFDESWQHRENLRECQESNLWQPGEKRKRYRN